MTTGKALKITRIEVDSYDHKDLIQPGVYFLFCEEDDIMKKLEVIVYEI